MKERELADFGIELGKSFWGSQVSVRSDYRAKWSKGSERIKGH